jgi:hypothetical protein
MSEIDPDGPVRKAVEVILEAGIPEEMLDQDVIEETRRFCSETIFSDVAVETRIPGKVKAGNALPEKKT